MILHIARRFCSNMLKNLTIFFFCQGTIVICLLPSLIPLLFLIWTDAKNSVMIPLPVSCFLSSHPQHFCLREFSGSISLSELIPNFTGMYKSMLTILTLDSDRCVIMSLNSNSVISYTGHFWQAI